MEREMEERALQLEKDLAQIECDMRAKKDVNKEGSKGQNTKAGTEVSPNIDTSIKPESGNTASDPLLLGKRLPEKVIKTENSETPRPKKQKMNQVYAPSGNKECKAQPGTSAIALKSADLPSAVKKIWIVGKKPGSKEAGSVVKTMAEKKKRIDEAVIAELSKPATEINWDFVTGRTRGDTSSDPSKSGLVNEDGLWKPIQKKKGRDNVHWANFLGNEEKDKAMCKECSLVFETGYKLQITSSMIAHSKKCSGLNLTANRMIEVPSVGVVKSEDPLDYHIDNSDSNHGETQEYQHDDVAPIQESKNTTLHKENDRKKPTFFETGSALPENQSLAQNTGSINDQCFKSDVNSLLRSLWADDTYKDVIITTSEVGFLIQCHSAVLSLASQFLKQILQDTKSNNESGQIYLHIADIDSAEIEKFVQALYCVRDSSNELQENAALVDCLKLRDQVPNVNTASFLPVNLPQNLSLKKKLEIQAALKLPKKVPKTTDRNRPKFKIWGHTKNDSPDAIQSPYEAEEIVMKSGGTIKDLILLRPCGADVIRNLRLRKKIEPCEVPMSFPLQKKSGLQAQGIKFMVKQYIQHKLPGYEGGYGKVQNTTTKETLAARLWIHFKYVHGLECIDLPCTNCFKKLTSDEKVQLPMKNGCILAQLCSDCLKLKEISLEKYVGPVNEFLTEYLAEESNRVKQFNLKAGKFIICNICKCEYYDHPDNEHSCIPFSSVDNEDSAKVPHLCNECGKTLMNKKKYDEHMNAEHRSGDPYPCTFDGCSFKSFSTQGLNNHYQRMHVISDGEKVKKCSKCQEIWTESHDADHHDPSLPFFCETCDYRALTKRGIEEHVNRTHDRMIQCDECPKLVTRGQMNNHKTMSHSKDLPFGCKHCGYRSASERGIKLHEGTHHNKKERTHPCLLGCGKFYHAGYTRNQHMKTCVYNENYRAEQDRIRQLSCERDLQRKKQGIMRPREKFESEKLKSTKTTIGRVTTEFREKKNIVLSKPSKLANCNVVFSGNLRSDESETPIGQNIKCLEETESPGFSPVSKVKMSHYPKWKNFLVNEQAGKAQCKHCQRVMDVNHRNAGVIGMSVEMKRHLKSCVVLATKSIQPSQANESDGKDATEEYTPEAIEIQPDIKEENKYISL